MSLATAPASNAWQTFFWCDSADHQNQVVLEREGAENQIVFRSQAVVAKLRALGAPVNSANEVVFSNLNFGYDEGAPRYLHVEFDGFWTIRYRTPGSKDIQVEKRDWANKNSVAVDSITGCQGDLTP